VDSQASERFLVGNVGLDTLHIIAGSLWIAQGTPFTFVRGQLNNKFLGPDSFLTPSVRYSPTSKSTDTNRIVIYSNDPDQDTVFVIVTGSGISGQLRRTSLDSSIDFGILKVGDVDTSATISVQNTLQDDRVRLVMADFVDTPQVDITVEADVHAFGETPSFAPFDPADLPFVGVDSFFSFRMIYAPEAPGTDSTIFRILGPEEKGPDTVDIPVNGRAAGPSLGVFPVSFDYGTLSVNPDSVRALALVVTNAGALDTLLDTLVIDTLFPVNGGSAHYNDDVVGAASYPSFPWIVPPGDTVTFALAVRVQARKVYYDTLAMINNDPAHDPFMLYTRVVGIAPGDTGFVDTIRISDYENEAGVVTVSVHLSFDEPIKRFSLPLRYTSEVYECVGFDFANTYLENVDGLVPTIDTMRNEIAIKGSVIFGQPIESDNVLAEGVFARLLFAGTPGVVAMDSSITFDTAFIQPDVGYGLQDTALRVILPEFVAGRLDILTGIDDDGVLPLRFELAQNFPNPFNPRTTIAFSVPRPAHVQLVVYNLLGQKIRTLVDEVMAAGQYEMDWHGRDQAGHEVSSGIYFYHLSAEAFSQTRKMVLMK
jgi:hypothetical protein